MSKLVNMILLDGVDIDAIGAYLDGLNPEIRLNKVRTLTPKAQRALWVLAEGTTVTLEQMVPEEQGTLQPVIHYGINTLPFLSLFQKRFCRPDKDDQQHVLWGYNEGVTRPIVGPGYFICRETPNNPRGEVVIDYYQVPTGKPPEWPEIRDNKSGLCMVVYGYMHDFMRRVSKNVTIGRAYKQHAETNNYFTLCREF